MPWQLTTPVDVGDLDVEPYDQIRIVRMMHDSVNQLVVVTLEYGRTVDGAWVRGVRPAGLELSPVIEGSSYQSLVTHASNDGEPTYEAVKRGLYEWLAIKGHVGAGEVV